MAETTVPRLGHRQVELLRLLANAGERGMLIYGNADRQAMASLSRRGLAYYIPGVDRGAKATALGFALGNRP